MLNSTYVVGKTWIAQAGYGIVQTGSLRTSQQDGAARHVDNVLRTGIILDEEGQVKELTSHQIEYGDDQVASLRSTCFPGRLAFSA